MHLTTINVLILKYPSEIRMHYVSFFFFFPLENRYWFPVRWSIYWSIMFKHLTNFSFLTELQVSYLFRTFIYRVLKYPYLWIKCSKSQNLKFSEVVSQCFCWELIFLFLLFLKLTKPAAEAKGTHKHNQEISNTGKHWILSYIKH